MVDTKDNLMMYEFYISLWVYDIQHSIDVSCRNRISYPTILYVNDIIRDQPKELRDENLSTIIESIKKEFDIGI